MKSLNGIFLCVCGQVDACVCLCVFFPFFPSLAAHVMTLGPRRPVLSWMLEIFRAMAMRGPNTTWRTGPPMLAITTQQYWSLGFGGSAQRKWFS